MSNGVLLGQSTNESGEYLPLTGGGLTGDLSINNSTNEYTTLSLSGKYSSSSPSIKLQTDGETGTIYLGNHRISDESGNDGILTFYSDASGMAFKAGGIGDNASIVFWNKTQCLVEPTENNDLTTKQYVDDKSLKLVNSVSTYGIGYGDSEYDYSSYNEYHQVITNGTLVKLITSDNWVIPATTALNANSTKSITYSLKPPTLMPDGSSSYFEYPFWTRNITITNAEMYYSCRVESINASKTFSLVVDIINPYSTGRNMQPIRIPKGTIIAEYFVVNS